MRSPKNIKCLDCRSKMRLFFVVFSFFSPRTIQFTDQPQISKDHFIYESKSHCLHGPFHSRTNVKLYPHSIPFTDHSLHGPFTDRCHGPIIYRLTSHTANMPINLSRTIPYTDHSIRPLPRTYNLQTNVTYTATMTIKC